MDPRGASLGTALHLSDQELALVRHVAALRGVTEEQAAEELFAEAFSAGMRKRIGRGASAAVRLFHRRGPSGGAQR